MAEEEVKIKYKVDDKATKPVNRIKLSTIALGTALGTLAVSGIKKLISSFNNFINLAGIQEQAVNNINQALIRNGTFTAEASKRAQEFASSLQQQTAFGDEAILNAQALLAELGNLSGEGLEKATESTLDLATRLNIDLKTASQLVGKSIGSSTNALARYGVQVEGAVGSTERLDNVVEGIGKLFGGAAKKETLTFAGQVKQLQNEIGDLQENIGFLIIKAIRPLVKIVKVGTSLINRNFNDMVKNVSLLFLDLKTFIQIITATLTELITAPFAWQTYQDIAKATIDRIFSFGKTIIGLFKSIKNLSISNTKKMFEKISEFYKKEAEENKTLEDKIIEIKANAAKQKEAILNDSHQKEIQANKDKNNEILAQEQAVLIKQNKEKKKQSEKEKKIAKEKADELIRIEKDKTDREKRIRQETTNFLFNMSKTALENEKGLAEGYGDFLKKRVISEINVFFAGKQAELFAVLVTNWWNPIGWAAAGQIAVLEAGKQAGMAAVNAVNFQSGGIVPGTSFQGDKVQANVNSGEMILNKKQQRNLFNMANSQIDNMIPRTQTRSQEQKVIILDSDGRTMLAKGVYQSTTDLLRTGQLQARR